MVQSSFKGVSKYKIARNRNHLKFHRFFKYNFPVYSNFSMVKQKHIVVFLVSQSTLFLLPTRKFFSELNLKMYPGVDTVHYCARVKKEAKLKLVEFL